MEKNIIINSKVLFCIILFLLSFSAWSDEKREKYEVKNYIGEIKRGIYKISPGVYEGGVSRSREEHIKFKDISLKK